MVTTCKKVNALKHYYKITVCMRGNTTFKIYFISCSAKLRTYVRTSNTLFTKIVLHTSINEYYTLVTYIRTYVCICTHPYIHMYTHIKLSVIIYMLGKVFCMQQEYAYMQHFKAILMCTHQSIKSTHPCDTICINQYNYLYQTFIAQA